MVICVLVNVSANFIVFESAFDIEIQFLMNVLSEMPIFEFPAFSWQCAKNLLRPPPGHLSRRVKMEYFGFKMGQVGRKIANLRPHLDHFFCILVVAFRKKAEVWKRTTLHQFWWFFEGSGCRWRVLEVVLEGLGSYVGQCWLQDSGFQAILGYVMASWSQDEPTGAQESESSRILGGRLEPRTGGNPQRWDFASGLA